MSKTKKVSDEIKININNEIDKIMELYKSKQIDSYNFTKLLNLDLDNYVLFLETISKIIYMTQGHQESDKNFKLSYFIQLVNLLVNTVLTYKNNAKIFQENIKYFLYLLYIIKDGHKFLQNIKYIIIVNDNNLKKDILTLSSINKKHILYDFYLVLIRHTTFTCVFY